MVGRAIIDLLKFDYDIIETPKICDLTSQKDTASLFDKNKPDYVIHLATYSGNIQFNTKFPADTYSNTSQMALNVFREANNHKVNKILSVLSSCAYPDISGELYENNLFAGQQHKSIESHGAAKRNLDVLSRLYNQQYGLNAVCVVLTNAYGEFDRFSVDRTKVVCGLLSKFIKAKESGSKEVICWGRGIELRELIYAKDAAKLIVKAFEEYNDNLEPVNIGTPHEISIKNLSELVASVVGFEYSITWDLSKPDGQLRKKLNLDKMNRVLLNNESFNYTPIETGLKNTYNWFIANKNTWTK